MSALAELQRRFQRDVLERSEHATVLFDRPADVDLAPRRAAYVEGYRGRLAEALGTSYAVLRTVLGDEDFDTLVRRYIEGHRSTHYSIRYYGADLAGFVGSEIAGVRGQTLAELARFEWTLAEVFDAADDVPLAPEALASVPPAAWSEVRFEPRASLRRLRLTTTAVEWWRYASGVTAEPPRFEAGAPTEWVLWRQGLRTLFRSLNPIEVTALDGLCRGLSFGELCEALADSVEPEAVALTAASFLRTSLAEELLAVLVLPSAAG